MERLRHEFEAIGFYLSAHPLDEYEAGLKRLWVVRAVDLPGVLAREKGRQKAAGIVTGKQERTSRQGNRFAFVQISDASGVFEVMLFSDLLSRCHDLLESGEPLLVTLEGRGDAGGGEGVRLTAQNLEPLDAAVAQAGVGLKIYLGDARPLDSLKSVLARDRRGRGRVSLVLDLAERDEVEIELEGRYRLSPAIRQAVKAIPGLVVQDA